MKNSVGIKILIVILILLIIVAAALLGIKFAKNQKEKQGTIITNEKETSNDKDVQVVETKQVKIYQGTDRPIAVMIDNNINALPQAGLNSAYMVYEIIVEGGETRLMALFKGVDLDKIGPIRSSRHYFLDYALENDAIYVHFGWSPQARSDMASLNVNNINGINESESSFRRATDSNHSYLHSVATSTKKILEIAKRKGYRTTSTKESVLNYNANEINLDSRIEATEVTIPYSTSNTVKYIYDTTTKRYTRYSRGEKQTDWSTGETITTKNIIITKCKNWALNDGEKKDRQTLKNITTIDGNYIKNGKAIKIKAVKESRSGQTVYQDIEGNKIEVNDGNTFVQICPIDSKIEITPGDTTNTTENTISTNTAD